MKPKLEKLINANLDLMQEGVDQGMRLSAQELGSVSRLYQTVLDSERQLLKDKLGELMAASDEELKKLAEA